MEVPSWNSLPFRRPGRDQPGGPGRAFRGALIEVQFRRLWKIPQLTYQITESYFDNNAILSEARDKFEKKSGFYERSIDNTDLKIQFADKDCKYFSHPG